MKWIFYDFEPDLRDLKPLVKEKAIEIATQLLQKSKFTKRENALAKMTNTDGTIINVKYVQLQKTFLWMRLN